MSLILDMMNGFLLLCIQILLLYRHFWIFLLPLTEICPKHDPVDWTFQFHFSFRDTRLCHVPMLSWEKAGERECPGSVTRLPLFL